MEDNTDERQLPLLLNQRLWMSRSMNFADEKLLTDQLQETKEKGKCRRRKSFSDKSVFPFYWKLNEMEPLVKKSCLRGKLLTVEDDVTSAVKQLVETTWQQRYVGHGKDGGGLSHTGIQVVKVERLENPGLWTEYSHRRDMIYKDNGYAHFRPIAKLPGSSGPVQTTANVPAGSPLRREIFPFEANEHYLFHGTKKKYIKNIINTGLDSRVTSDKAMLGQGIYAAESPTKADQYADDKHQRTSEEKTMVLVRMVLGNPFINTKSDPAKFKRPPCKRCFKDVCSCDDPYHFHSVIDDAVRNFREFVVYDRSMCYPEYFITYNRV